MLVPTLCLAKPGIWQSGFQESWAVCTVDIGKTLQWKFGMSCHDEDQAIVQDRLNHDGYQTRDTGMCHVEVKLYQD